MGQCLTYAFLSEAVVDGAVVGHIALNISDGAGSLQ